MITKKHYLVLLLATFNIVIFCSNQTRVIGLLVGKNQECLLPVIISAMAFFTDSIICYDNKSKDTSITVLKSLAQTYPLQIIEGKHELPMNEIYNQLLQEGRRQQGTHFLVLHADEIPTAEYVISGRLKKAIHNLKNGESLYLRIIGVEKNYFSYYQDDTAQLTEKNYIGCAFADNRDAFYAQETNNRIPTHINGMQWYWQDDFCNGLMVCYDYLFKQYVLEACVNKINKKIDVVDYWNQKINALYQTIQKEPLQKAHTPFCWFAGYLDFFNADSMLKTDQQIEKTILQLCQMYGIDFFIDIDMWDYEWHFFNYLPLQENTSMKSQYKQDLLINTYFFNNKKNGFFVDVGAHDGIRFSNSYFFEQTLGWQGLCIEPIKNAYHELVQNRKTISINACAGKENGYAEFFNVQGDPDQLSGLVDSYHPLHKKRMEGEIQKTNGSYSIERVPVYTLKSLFEKYTITHVDYLSLDTEGSEMEILEGIDFDKVYIKAMTIENMYFGTELSNFMRSKGFKKVARLFNCDDVYVNMKKE